MVSNGNCESISSKQIDEYITAEREIYRRLQMQTNQTFINSYAFLESACAEEYAFIGSYAPMMIVELTKDQVQALSKDKSVEALYYSPPIMLESEMDVSIPLVRADYVRTISTGYTGAGIKIGLLDQSIPDKTAEHLEDADINILSGNQDDVHGSIVASILVSQDDTLKGIVPDATLYCTTQGDDDSGFYSSIESLISAGVHIINMSAEVYYYPEEISPENRRYGECTEFEKWVDHIAINHSIHFVTSAGNTGSHIACSYQNQLTHPAMAFNVITVGNINDCFTNSFFNASASVNFYKEFPFVVNTSDDIKRISLTWLLNAQILYTGHGSSSANVTTGSFADLYLTIIAPNGTTIPLSVSASSNSDDNLIIIRIHMVTAHILRV